MFVEYGKEVGTESFGGKEHPVYEIESVTLENPTSRNHKLTVATSQGRESKQTSLADDGITFETKPLSNTLTVGLQ